MVDLQMAEMNGYEFVNELRARDGQAMIPVIVSSGPGSGDFALPAGADRFLAKPFRATS